jgi:hypothetical protein
MSAHDHQQSTAQFDERGRTVGAVKEPQQFFRTSTNEPKNIFSNNAEQFFSRKSVGDGGVCFSECTELNGDGESNGECFFEPKSDEECGGFFLDQQRKQQKTNTKRRTGGETTGGSFRADVGTRHESWKQQSVSNHAHRSNNSKSAKEIESVSSTWEQVPSVFKGGSSVDEIETRCRSISGKGSLERTPRPFTVTSILPTDNSVQLCKVHPHIFSGGFQGDSSSGSETCNVEIMHRIERDTNRTRGESSNSETSLQSDRGSVKTRTTTDLCTVGDSVTTHRINAMDSSRICRSWSDKVINEMVKIGSNGEASASQVCLRRCNNNALLQSNNNHELSIEHVDPQNRTKSDMSFVSQGCNSVNGNAFQTKVYRHSNVAQLGVPGQLIEKTLQRRNTVRTDIFRLPEIIEVSSGCNRSRNDNVSSITVGRQSRERMLPTTNRLGACNDNRCSDGVENVDLFHAFDHFSEKETRCNENEKEIENSYDDDDHVFSDQFSERRLLSQKEKQQQQSLLRSTNRNNNVVDAPYHATSDASRDAASSAADNNNYLVDKNTNDNDHVDVAVSRSLKHVSEKREQNLELVRNNRNRLLQRLREQQLRTLGASACLPVMTVAVQDLPVANHDLVAQCKQVQLPISDISLMGAKIALKTIEVEAATMLSSCVNLDDVCVGSGKDDGSSGSSDDEQNNNLNDIGLDCMPTSSNSHGMIYWNGNERRQIPRMWCMTRSSDANLPLAPVTSPEFDYNVLRKWWTIVLPQPALIEMVEWISTDSLSKILSLPEYHIDRIDDKTTRVVNFDIAPLLTSRTIEVLQPHQSNFITAPVFTVPKSDGKTSRFILDGRTFDSIFRKAIGAPPLMPLPQIPEVVDQILSGWNIISSNDAKSMFYQFPLHPELRKYFGFTLGVGRRRQTKVAYRMCALPMGVCFAPTFAQHVSNYFCEVVRYNVPSSIKFVLFPWVDNFILLTNSVADDRHIRTVFDRIAAELHLIMKGWEGGAAALDALGISFDLAKHSAKPTNITCDKIASLTDSLLTSQRERSHVNNFDYIRWFGTIQWASYSTARLPLCFCPVVMEVIREICRHEDWKGQSNASIRLASEITSIAKACVTVEYTPSSSLSNAVRSPCLEQPRYTAIWSDASTTAIAAVDTSRHLCFSHRLLACTHRQMCAAELAAGMCGFITFGDADIWVTDNQAAARALSRGHSGSFGCDAILRSWLGSGRFPRYVMWVDTACQIADSLTRPDEKIEAKPCAAEHLLLRVRWRGEGVGILCGQQA